MAVQANLTTEEKVKFSFAPATPSGKPGLIDGSVTSEVLSGSATVTMNPDGMSGFIVSGDTAGDSEILFSADADTTAGVKTITETVNATVTDPQVTTLGFTLGTPEPK